jgi:hypothetical protein
VCIYQQADGIQPPRYDQYDNGRPPPNYSSSDHGNPDKNAAPSFSNVEDLGGNNNSNGQAK